MRLNNLSAKMLMTVLVILGSASCKKPVYYNISTSVQPVGSGSIVATPSSESVLDGTSVTFKATPNGDYVFTGWSGSLSGTSNPETITIYSDLNIIANFVLIEYPLTIEVIGEGKVSEQVISTKTDYSSGTVVELKAVPAEFWAFDHWEGDLSGKASPATITINTPKQVKAVFVEHDPGIVFTETEYVDPYAINRRLGLGFNLSCQLDAYRVEGDHIITDETYWGNPKCTQELFTKAAAAGIKSVRIPITWIGTFGPAPDYKIDEARLDRIAEVVGYAEHAGMNAIINMHHDSSIPQTSDPAYQHLDEFWIKPEKAAADPSYDAEVKNRLKALWTQIARKFRDKGDFLMFESFNEPGNGFFWSWATDAEKDAHQAEFDCLNEWNQIFVDAVRATGGNNAKRWLFVVGAAAKERNLDRFIIPKDYVSNNRLVLAIHFWEPEGYVVGKYDEWGRTAMDLNDENVRFDEQFIASELPKYKAKYLDKGIPICIDEMGCWNRDTERGKAFQLYYLEYLIRAAKLNGLSTFIWDDGARNDIRRGFYLFWHKTGEFFDYAEELFDIIRDAAYSDDPAYTLKSVYDRAPFQDPEADKALDGGIPDPVFKQYLISSFDRDGDGILNKFEALRVTRIDINASNSQIEKLVSVQGIELFPNLKALVVSGSATQKCGLKELNVSSCASLEELRVNNCQISSFHASGMPELYLLDLGENPITSFSLSDCPKISRFNLNNVLLSFADLPNLTQWPLVTLHLSTVAHKMPANYLRSFPNLTECNFCGFEGESIDLSLNTHLEYLWCYDMKNISTLDLSNAPNIKALYTGGCPKLTTVYFDKNAQLKEIEKDAHTEIIYGKP